MGTAIYGGIEFRHPYTGTDDYNGEPWVTAMDLWPLYDEGDYTAFGLLFGVRNYAGFPPLAPGRGLPVDLSSGMRSALGPWVARGEMDGVSWASWGELASIDPATGPEHYVGRVAWHKKSLPSTLHRQLVSHRWPPEVLSVVGEPPVDAGSSSERVEWTTGDLVCTYEPLTVEAVLGPGT
ncbi:hypothetical protein, partial [Streptomyces sp. NPDC005009]